MKLCIHWINTCRYLHLCFVEEEPDKQNISCKNLIVQCFSFRLHHIVKDGIEENWAFVLHIWSLLTPCLPDTSNANKEARPFLPSPYTHHPMKAGATVLQNYIATLEYLFISYSSLHCINFPLTNQTLLLEKTVWLFLLDKCIYSYTDPHRQLMLHVLGTERELLALSSRLQVCPL